jgi:signal transduction histidine kinase
MSDEKATGDDPQEASLAYRQALAYGKDLVRVYLAEKARREELEIAHRELEKRVEERTAALREANRRLKQEIEERQQAEEAERERARELAVVEERQRIARELHDAVSQTLWSAKLLAEALPALWEQDVQEGQEMLAELKGLIGGALAEMRTLLLELRPERLVEKPLAELLVQLGDSLVTRTGVTITVDAEEGCSLPPDVRVALYRIAQEALNNVIRHASPRTVRLTMVCRESDMTLSVRDDGRGFNPENVPPGHFGISIMRERAAEIGADFAIVSERDHGTLITVVWPAEGRSEAEL